MHYYTFKPKDYMSKTAFLEPLEDLAYRRMLDHCYLTKNPLPKDIEEIAMLIRMRTHTDCIRTVLHYFFELTNDGYVNDKVLRELSAYHSKSSKAKASADARWEKQRNKIKDLDVKTNECDSNANALSCGCKGNANQQPITNNQEPIYIQNKPVKFMFKGELEKLGADKQLVSDWLVVRKGKKAANTETALKGFVSQVEKSGLELNTVLKICVDNSWSGFKQDWISSINLSDYQESSTSSEKQEQPARKAIAVPINYLD